MEYNPNSAVWEITMACNMRCKHCGSSCKEKLPDELSTSDVLALCDDLIDIGVERITLSGGEPTIRKDWPLIVRRLSDNGVTVNLITNGWIWNDELTLKVRESGINGVGISIDGMQETHDYIRRSGSFAKSISCIKEITSCEVKASVLTTINKRNILELNDMFDLFSDLGLTTWQLQISLPMGNFIERKEIHLEPYHMDEIIDFAYDHVGKGVKIVLADRIGYYDLKSITVMRNHYGNNWYWDGCGAGKKSIGILHNGDITACTSLRSPDFVVGNIKKESISEIWGNPLNFSWNREIKKTDLSGLCKKCQYGEVCLGGCSNSRLCMNGSVYSNNRFCSYHTAIFEFEHSLGNLIDGDNYDELIDECIREKQYQLAEIVINKKLKTKNMGEEEKIATLEMCAYVSFKLGNYNLCSLTNERILKHDKNNAYAWKGLILAKIKQGDILGGIQCLLAAEEFVVNHTAEFYRDICATIKSVGDHSLVDELHAKAKKCHDYNEDKFKDIL